jgi:ketosteroid isomerase-like protein
VTHKDVTREWADAWNSHDIGKLLALLAKDIEIDQPENDKPLDYGGARKLTGTWTGPFVNPSSGKVTPGSGRHFDHPGATVLLYDANGKIRRVSIYWDQLTIDRQLGIIPR